MNPSTNEFKLRYAKNSTLLEFYLSEGGVIPEALSGLYTSPTDANNAKNRYLYNRDVAPVVRHEERLEQKTQRKASGKPLRLKPNVAERKAALATQEAIANSSEKDLVITKDEGLNQSLESTHEE